MKINKVNIHAFRLFGDESVDFSAKKDSRKTTLLHFMLRMDLAKQVSSIQWNSV